MFPWSCLSVYFIKEGSEAGTAISSSEWSDLFLRELSDLPEGYMIIQRTVCKLITIEGTRVHTKCHVS